MRVIDGSGRFLDAKYSIEPDGECLALIIDSRTGKPKRNSEYNLALDILLTRLAVLDAELVDALVDSERTREWKLTEQQRRIIDRPRRLADEIDIVKLRRAMGTVQAKVGRAPGASGGSSNKRLRLRLQIPGYQLSDAGRLADAIAVPASELHSTPAAILQRLPVPDSRPPTEDEYATASRFAEDLDKLVQAVRRVEQAYLRRVLFPGNAASCDLCGRRFAVAFLVAAHVKRRSACTDTERRDVAHIVMSACRFGCDELFERGYITVAPDGALILSPALRSCDQARDYAEHYLAGRTFGRQVDGRGSYLRWHRENVFLAAVANI